MKFFILKKETFLYLLFFGMILIVISSWIILKGGDMVVFNQQNRQKARNIHMVTGEFKSKMNNGKELEAYRWDPGTIFLKKGEDVNLYIYGINGKKHPFYIEGTNLKGSVAKGEEVLVPLHFEKLGTYRLICQTHFDKYHNGPMIAYIVVN